jgi:periplasmic protein TonB
VKVPPSNRSVVELFDPSLPAAPTTARGGGGGGDQSPLDASRGSIMAQHQQLTPPQAVVRNEEPKLEAMPTIIADARMPSIGKMGNPRSRVEVASDGTGSSSGIGTGSNGGVGTGVGRGLGPGSVAGTGGGVFRIGGGVSAPIPIYQPEAQFSEEARKLKHQGSVIVQAVIGPDGKPRDLRVIRALGMGLDEKALEAVRSWKFKPALKDGQAVAVIVNVEVNFRLY